MFLEILTPEKRVYSGEVYGVQLPGADGLFELLDKHAAIVSELNKGNIKILASAKKDVAKNFSISGGFVEMLNNNVSVLIEGVTDLS